MITYTTLSASTFNYRSSKTMKISIHRLDPLLIGGHQQEILILS